MSAAAMTEALPPSVLDAAITRLGDALLDQRTPEGIWRGRLSSSALATATAISALAAAGEAADRPLIHSGRQWLADDQNADGGWGDSPESPSNLSTTLLALAALRLSAASEDGAPSPAEAGARAYVHRHAGDEPPTWRQSLQRIYGHDRTFAVPILTNLAIAGLVPWKLVPGLPYHLAALPPQLYRLLRLQVVSYALPALIAIGARLAREHGGGRFLRRRALAKLPPLQPTHGGFLDAIPLTSFVAMALAGMQDRPAEVLPRCLAFLRCRQREDGSWPIDTDLATWLTTASVEALHAAGRLECLNDGAVRSYLQAAQQREVHPYTQAAPGGWGWTNLPGGVPDADDTSGALLALSRMRAGSAETQAGLRWLLSLQNRDGGFPTFCRGWGRLPFDHSAPEVTAHAIRAVVALFPDGAPPTGAVTQALRRAVRYLEDTQDSRGAWKPLWFGSQHSPDRANYTIGTARVLRALEALDGWRPEVAPGYLARRGVQYLLESQQADGGWGADKNLPASVEETALAVSALAGWPQRPEVMAALRQGARYLLRALAAGSLDSPSPIGLYFASLWYSERLYPWIWTLEALGRLRQAEAKHHTPRADGATGSPPGSAGGLARGLRQG